MRDLLRKYALQNAVLYEGKADPKAVTGKVLAADASLRSRAREVAEVARQVCNEVNALPPARQRQELEALAPELLERKEEAAPAELPPLPDVRGPIVVRLAPYPSGPLHIGNARAALLNDAYAKRHGGKFLLVYDDTIGSEEKLPLEEAYGLIEDGLRWLGVTVHEVHYKSDRLPLFYEWSERLLRRGGAYVCLCPAEDLRRQRAEGTECAHRAEGVEENLQGWRRMLDGSFGEGEATVRLKTDMKHPNPAFRDRVLFRISERAHPRVGTRYRVWPLLEFSWAVDDVLLGVTHVLRGKDLMMEDEMERAIWGRLDLHGPSFVHYGLFRLTDMELSKSKAQRAIAEGRLTGTDDPRTWSLQSLRRRGFDPEAVRAFVLSFGLSLADVEVPAEGLYAENRRRIDPQANRAFFVPDPVPVRIEGLPDRPEARVPVHPDFPDRGERRLATADTVHVARRDLEALRGRDVRLKDFCNVRLGEPAAFLSFPVADVPKIQWLAAGVSCRVLLPDGSVEEGLVEPTVGTLPAGTVLQFERYGFVRLDAAGPPLTACFAHR